MAGERDCESAIVDVHRRPRTIGFEPVPVTKAAGSATRFRVTPTRLVAAVEKVLAARGAASAASTRATWLHHDAGNDDLRKDAALAARG